jgi:hypothetical protein
VLGMTDAPTPASDWDYALSAADELAVAHLTSVPDSAVRERQAAVVVVLAAALYACAQAARLHGPDTARTPVHDVAEVLQDVAAVGEVLAAAPARPVRGREQQQLLTEASDGRAGSELREVARGAGEVLHSALKSTPGGGTLAGWSATRQQRRRAEILSRLAAEQGTED